ncbi:hypothetical protein [Stenotrophomonas acidaminiphila]
MRSVLFVCLLLGWPLHSNAQVVVLAHPDSGDFVVVQNRPSPRTEAMQRADARKHAGGWKLLLGSTVPGHGAMFCFRPKGAQMRYFIAEGKLTGSEAVNDARTQANTAARGSGATTAICGNWNNRNIHPLDAQDASPATVPPTITTPGVDRGEEAPRKDGERGLMETVRRQMHERMACDPKQNNCPPPPKPRSVGIRG